MKNQYQFSIVAAQRFFVTSMILVMSLLTVTLAATPPKRPLSISSVKQLSAASCASVLSSLARAKVRVPAEIADLVDQLARERQVVAAIEKIQGGKIWVLDETKEVFAFELGTVDAHSIPGWLGARLFKAEVRDGRTELVRGGVSFQSKFSLTYENNQWVLRARIDHGDQPRHILFEVIVDDLESLLLTGDPFRPDFIHPELIDRRPTSGIRVRFDWPGRNP